MVASRTPGRVAAAKGPARTARSRPRKPASTVVRKSASSQPAHIESSALRQTSKAAPAQKRATRKTVKSTLTDLSKSAPSNARAHLGQWPQGVFDVSPVTVKPEVLAALQADYTQAVQHLVAGVIGTEPVAHLSDKRFSTAAWQGPHATLAGLYLLNARFMDKLADSLETDAKSKAKIRFAVSQWVDAMSPSNYLATNPEAQQKLIESRGQSLTTGLLNMFADIEKGRISQTDESAFEVGRNLATTPGNVVFQNHIFQLIQYKPATKQVFQRPLLMVPPCINKFYILDLQPENSLVLHAVSKGHTVFMVSWKNPQAADAALTWDDYIEDGVIKAVALVQHISQQQQLNLLGFCVGGTMLATALAVLAARHEEPCKSLTLLTTLLDFSDTGMLDVFVDETVVSQRERSIGGQGGPPGLMPARDLATSFSFLRPNDLVWNYVVSNYLKGESPPPFDLLFWNGDGTNLPGPFFTWYLRHTYLENRLKDPHGVTVCGAPVDLRKITAPTYIYGSREDHIVPWPTAYQGTQLLSGRLRFVLGASGHIAGVINPPQKNKRSFWSGDAPIEASLDADRWFAQALEAPGSWWPDWTGWLEPFAGKKIQAPVSVGRGNYRSIEPAPGSYVRVRAA